MRTESDRFIGFDQMKFFNSKAFQKDGKTWLFGDFKPSLLQTKDFEVGIHSHKKGEESDGHYHRKFNEYNFVISGKVLVGDNILSPGLVFLIEPHERSDVKFLEDTVLLVVRNGSDPGDKFYE